ncbi:hypothetical protein C2S52_014601 [Perilla frutescens var. hirtella]|nr:hypothetical protein C2S52_014601 [Perilla frutescens var. hirtella]KAH6816559.1 hypothetical protein C2S51_021379 [Perilla frutescens var. frutescens]
MLILCIYNYAPGRFKLLNLLRALGSSKMVLSKSNCFKCILKYVDPHLGSIEGPGKKMKGDDGGIKGADLICCESAI